MSVGHAHGEHEEIDEKLFLKAQRDPRFQSILAHPFDVSFDYDIPYLGGYSLDGSRLYIDRDTPQVVPGRYRRPIYLWPDGIVRGIFVHEHWEKTAMLAWNWEYDKAHELANRAEHRFVDEQLGIPFAAYNDIWDPLISISEKKTKRWKELNLPPDLDKTPYREPPDPMDV